MRRRTDPKTFDLSTACPECDYKIPQPKLLWIDSKGVHCPHCQRDVVVLPT
jgi:DNA-directed RNA polymerase subunit RPC12/RpoP